jgi:uridine kinase
MNKIIGICGGSGSGKTTLAQKLKNELHENSLLLSLDSYYRNLKGLSLSQKELFNYDEPSAFDLELLTNDLDKLAKGIAITPPCYDFKTSTRIGFEGPVESQRIIILEGLFLLSLEEIRERLDLSIFLNVDQDIRLERRLSRDVRERGRSVESVIKRMTEVVFPMHDLHIEPFKDKAHLIICNNHAVLDVEAVRIANIIDKRFPFEGSQEVLLATNS